MPRAIWTGSISFGLVNVPVRLYGAISEHKLHFSLVHEPDQSPIGYQEVCKLEDKPVPDDEVVKAFELEPAEYVLMEDEDFEAARVEGYRTIEITDFVPYEQVDPIYFARTYYLGPEEGGEKVYALLLRALEDSGLTGISKFVMRDRQYLGALRLRDGLIALEQMYFADEVRSQDDIKPAKASVSKEELAMAEQQHLSVVPDVEHELDRLYALPLEEFTNARNDLAKRLVKAGQSEAAADVKKLTKPSIPVWTANQLARREPGELRALLRSAEDLRKAQERALAGKGVADLQKRLGEQRRAGRALAKLGPDILAGAGRPVSDALVERIARTLDAPALDEG